MTLKGGVIKVAGHFCLGNHSERSPSVISAQMRISSPFLSQLEVWSDHALVNAQLDPKTIQSNERKCVITLAIRASSHYLRTANQPPTGLVAAAQTVYYTLHWLILGKWPVTYSGRIV
jgi:hypothetical protein